MSEPKSKIQYKFDLANISSKRIAIIIALMVFNITLRALVLSKIWQWFMVRLYNAPAIGMVGAMGIVLFLRLAFANYPRTKDIEYISINKDQQTEELAMSEENTWSIINIQESSMVLQSLGFFVLAYFIQLFI